MRKLLFSSLTIGILSLLAILPVSSCTKEIERVNTSPLGLWEGTFLTDQTVHDPGHVAFALYSDSTISRRTQNPIEDIYHKGRWTIANNKITFTDTTINFSQFVIQTGSFDYDAATNTLKNGKWQHIDGLILSGTFSNLKKIK